MKPSEYSDLISPRAIRSVVPLPAAHSPGRGVSFDAKAAANNSTGPTILTETDPDDALTDGTQHQEPIPTQEEQGKQQENSAFRDALTLPNVSPTIYVYPHSGSEINDAFRNRFREVINLFRLNTEQHPPLKAHLEHIDYELRMCGTSIHEAHPSIIAFCRPSEFSHLRSLLNSKHLKMQYCRRKSTPKYSWKSLGKSAVTQSPDTFKPLFSLYFWRTSRPRILYSGRHSMKSASVFIDQAQTPHSRLTMSGSVVASTLLEGGCLTSTIGCLLQVDSEFYGLTAAHLVDPERLYETKTTLCSSMHCTNKAKCTPQGSDEVSIITRERENTSDDGYSITTRDRTAELACTVPASLQILDPDHQIIDGDDDFVDDIDYEDLEESDQEEPAATESRKIKPILCENGQARQTTILAPSSCSKFCTCSDVPDNDWALVAIDSTEPQLPNAFFDANNMSNPVFFSNTPGSLPAEETPVFILTSNRRPLKGMLQPIPSFLGGITRNVQAEYWTVILSRGAALRSGDSGSIVVGAESPTLVYGHVVASNTIGNVYVSPLEDTIRQITILLATTHVSLPEPLPLLTGLSSYYLEKGDDYAFQTLKYLDDCIHANQQSSDWPSLESWALCHQREELLKAVKNSLKVFKDPAKVRMVTLPR